MARQSATDLIVHIVWGTHGRRPILSVRDDAMLASMLHTSARRIGCELVAVGNATNHVHVVARVARDVAVARLVQHLKGRTSYFGGWKWQRGYFAESVAISDLAPLCAYVNDQRQRHDDSHPGERWNWEPADRRA